MGLRKSYVDFIGGACSGVAGKSMLELGNQRIHDRALGYKCNTGKEYWLSCGVSRHVSIDINGMDGAHSLDLSCPIAEYVGEFDIVTDIGVSCYIPKYHACFENMVGFCRPGGIIVHILPLSGSEWTCDHFTSAVELAELCQEHDGHIIAVEAIPGEYGDQVAFAWSPCHE